MKSRLVLAFVSLAVAAVLGLTSSSALAAPSQVMMIPQADWDALTTAEVQQVQTWADNNDTDIVHDPIDAIKLPALKVKVCQYDMTGHQGWLIDMLGWMLCTTEDICFSTMHMVMIDANNNRHVCKYDCDTTPLPDGTCDCDIKSGQPSICPV